MRLLSRPHSHAGLREPCFLAGLGGQRMQLSPLAQDLAQLGQEHAPALKADRLLLLIEAKCSLASHRAVDAAGAACRCMQAMHAAALMVLSGREHMMQSSASSLQSWQSVTPRAFNSPSLLSNSV